VYHQENKTYRNAKDYTPKNRMTYRVLYTIKYRCLSGRKKGKICEVEMYADSIKEARLHFNLDWKQEKIISIKKNDAYNKNAKFKNETMAKKKKYTKSKAKYTKAKNTQKGTARSTKKYKVVMMKPSKTKIKKMFTSKRTEISPKIISFAKSCGCRVMWQVYTYRPSLKAYRLVKTGSATQSTSRVRA